MPAPAPLTFRCEWITPAFLGGPDPAAPELSAGGFLGGLRFWTRAMLGAVLGADLGSRKQIRWLEGRLWGDTRGAAAVGVRTRWEASEPEPNLVVLNDLDDEQLAGVRYLAGQGVPLFVPREFKPIPDDEQKEARRKERVDTGRQAYLPGTRFLLDLAPRTTLPQVQEAAAAALWLLTWCGGVGARSRRGFGGFRVLSPVRVALSLPLGVNPNLVFQSPAADKVVNHYQLGLGAAYAAFARFANRLLPLTGSLIKPEKRVGVFQQNRAARGVSPVCEFSSFANWRATVSTEAWGTCWEALGALGYGFRGARTLPGDRWHSPDYRSTVEPLFTGTLASGPHEIPNCAFGLPVGYRSSTRRMTAWVNWAPAEGKEGRRASPLFLRLVPLQGGSFATLAVLLQAEFLPPDPGLTLTVDPDTWKVSMGSCPAPVALDVPGYGRLQEFVLREHGGDSGCRWIHQKTPGT